MRPALSAVLALLLATPAAGQSLTPAQRSEVVGVLRETLRADPSILREALLALQADDARREETATQNTLAKLAGTLVDPADPVLGNPLANVTIVEFYDTRCPYCRRMLPTHAALLQADPNVRIVFKDLPILGPASQLEGRALLAAQRQGRSLGLDIVGFYHSHPDHPAQWSATDFAEAHWFGCSYVITAVEGDKATGRSTVTNSFLLTGTGEDDKAFEPQPVEFR